MKIHEIENNVENFEKNMTVYFNKKTGKIIACHSGIADMTPYKKQDSELLEIWDYEILPINNEVIYNKDNFKIQNGEIRLIKTLNPVKYRIAD